LIVHHLAVQLVIKKPPFNDVTIVNWSQYKRTALTLNPPLTAASKNGDWEQTIARCTARLRPSHDIVRSEYLPESRSIFKVGSRFKKLIFDGGAQTVRIM
jgi:hypothetical protein